MDGIGLILLAIAIWWLAPRFFASRPGPPRRLPDLHVVEELGGVERVFHTPYDQDREGS